MKHMSSWLYTNNLFFLFIFRLHQKLPIPEMLMKNSDVCSYCCFADWKPTLMLLRKSEKPPPLFGRRHLDIKTVMTWSQAFHYVFWEMMTQWHLLSNGWITAFSWCDKRFICGVLHFWRWNWVPSFHQAMKCLGGQHRFKRSYKSILSIWWKLFL